MNLRRPNQFIALVLMSLIFLGTGLYFFRMNIRMLWGPDRAIHTLSAVDIRKGHKSIVALSPRDQVTMVELVIEGRPAVVFNPIDSATFYIKRSSSLDDRATVLVRRKVESYVSVPHYWVHVLNTFCFPALFLFLGLGSCAAARDLFFEGSIRDGSRRKWLIEFR